MPIQQLFEQAIAQPRFSGPTLRAALLPVFMSDSRTPLTPYVTEVLGSDLAGHVLTSLVRSAFLIELVKHPKIETTKFEVRWAARLPPSDPRYASFETCLAIFNNLLEGLMVASRGSQEWNILETFKQFSVLPYEIPVDYQQRRLTAPIHTPDNVVWLWNDPAIVRTIALRRAVRGEGIVAAEAAIFERVLDKVRVKTYLTDRALTGAHKTNREKRWEAHPASVQFATRALCLGIERELIEQVCYFEGFPQEIQEVLRSEGVISWRETSVCPVTLAPLQYGHLKKELLASEHGKSSFHVGHLNPLKAVSDDPNVGHTAHNIAWISENGNRIQGNLSVADTRRMLFEMAQRYEARHWFGLGSL